MKKKVNIGQLITSLFEELSKTLDPDLSAVLTADIISKLLLEQKKEQ